MRGPAVVAWRVTLSLSVALAGCRDRGPSPSAPPEPAAPAPLPPPSASFSMPEHRDTGGVTRRPPEAALLDAWVFVKQTRPRPRKNPRWRHAPAREQSAVEMPEGSTWRCVVAPVTLAPIEGEDGPGLRGWLATRAMRCTPDGWRSFVEGAHVVRVLPDGRREPVNAQGELHLRERRDGRAVELSVVLRTDDPRRKPTHGAAFARRTASGAAGSKATEDQASATPPIPR